MKNLIKFWNSLSFSEKSNILTASFMIVVLLFAVGLFFYPILTVFLFLGLAFTFSLVYLGSKVYKFYKFVKEENAQ